MNKEGTQQANRCWSKLYKVLLKEEPFKTYIFKDLLQINPTEQQLLFSPHNDNINQKHSQQNISPGSICILIGGLFVLQMVL